MELARPGRDGDRHGDQRKRRGAASAKRCTQPAATAAALVLNVNDAAAATPSSTRS